MNIHEYQAKEILKKYGVPIPPFAVALSVDEAISAAKTLHLKEAVLKIQVHAGGRGEAGGVKFAKNLDELKTIAQTLIGMKMVGKQTGPEGVIAHKVLVSKPLDIAKEFYISVLIDRSRAEPVLIASPEGGMDIEEVAQKFPEKIIKIPFGLNAHIRSYQLIELCKFMGWHGAVAEMGKKIVVALAQCFIDIDASLIEINPLVLTPSNELIALDAKIALDDNALFRHKELAALYDSSQESPQEAAAKLSDLAYIAMHGEIGCMVNGAGLAMATMDMIELVGGSPANFLDVGGSATKEKVAEGFRIILSDTKVRAILVNIFGGIMNCATIAEGVIYAAKKERIEVPIIVRLEGTNVEEGRKIFKESFLQILIANDLASAAKMAVQAARG